MHYHSFKTRNMMANKCDNQFYVWGTVTGTAQLFITAIMFGRSDVIGTMG